MALPKFEFRAEDTTNAISVDAVVPTPGSAEAVALGCGCPRIDNGHGRGNGMSDEDGSPLFWVNADCTLHGTTIMDEPASLDSAV
jgi:hypothetical protein